MHECPSYRHANTMPLVCQSSARASHKSPNTVSFSLVPSNQARDPTQDDSTTDQVEESIVIAGAVHGDGTGEPPPSLPTSLTVATTTTVARIDRSLKARPRPQHMLIRYRDDGFRERSEKNMQRLVFTALSSHDSSATSTILARKALQYRKILPLLDGNDLVDPTFNLSQRLGIRWQRIESDV